MAEPTTTLPPRDPSTGQFTAPTPPAAASTPGATPPENQPPEEKPSDKSTAKPEGDMSGINKLVSRFLGEKEPTDKPEGKQDEKAPKKPKTEPQKPPAATKPAAAPKTEEEPDEDARTTRIATAVATEVARVLKPTEKKSDPAEPELPAQEQRKLKVLERMEKLYPDNPAYKNLSTRYKSSFQALKDYAAKWTKDHPNEAFDEDAPEHTSFFEQHDIDWEDDHYVEALADMRAETRSEENNRDLNKRLSEFERKEKLREAIPTIMREQNTAAQLFWKTLGKDFDGVVKPDGSLDMPKLEALRKADPVTFDMRVQDAEALDTEVAMLYAVMNGLEEWKESNNLHVALGEFAQQKETELMQRSKAERKNEKGQDFLPAAEYFKLPKDDRQKRFWTFTATDLAALRSKHRASELAKKIATEEDKLKKFAEARGYRLDKPPEKEDEQPTGQEQDGIEESDDKPASPSAGGASKLAASKSTAKADDANPLNVFGNKFLGIR